MADDIVQVIQDAREDAVSLSQFIYYPASTMVERRLAPSIHTLNYYLDYLHGLELIYSQPTGTVTVNGEEVKTVRQAITDSVDSVIIGDYQTQLEDRVSANEDEITSVKSDIQNLPVVEGKIPASEVSVAAGVTQEDKNSELQSEINAQKLDTGITATAKFGGVERTQHDKNSESVTPEDFGAIGDGVADDTTAISNFLNSGVRGYTNKNKVYKITSDIEITSDVVVSGQFNIQPAYIQSNRRGGVINFSKGTTAAFENLYAYVPSNAIIYTVIKAGYDFTANKIELICETQQANGVAPGPDVSALYFHECNNVNIKHLYVKNFDTIAWLSGVNSFNVDKNEFYSCTRGYQVDGREVSPSGWGTDRGYGCKNFTLGTVIGYGDSPNATYSPGHNILCLGGLQTASIGDCFIYDTGEHGIRMFRGDAAKVQKPENISFGNIHIYRAGACGFKVSSDVHNISIKGLYVEDAAYAIRNEIDIYHAVSGNHFGLFLDNCINVNIGWYRTRRIKNTYNSRHNAKLRNTSKVSIGVFEGDGAYLDAISIQNYADTLDCEDIRIESGSVRDFGLGIPSAGVSFRVSDAITRRLYINLNYFGGATCVDWTELSGDVRAECLFTGFHDDIAAVMTPDASGKMRNHIRQMSLGVVGYTVSSQAAVTNLPLGQVILVKFEGGTTPTNQFRKNIYASPDNTGYLTDDATDSKGAQLAGEWRSKGIMNTTHVLMQRVR